MARAALNSERLLSTRLRYFYQARDIFWVKLIMGTFIALQMKSFIPKKFKLHAGAKMCYSGNFSERAGMAVSFFMALNNPWQDFKKSFCFEFL